MPRIRRSLPMLPQGERATPEVDLLKQHGITVDRPTKTAAARGFSIPQTPQQQYENQKLRGETRKLMVNEIVRQGVLENRPLWERRRILQRGLNRASTVSSRTINGRRVQELLSQPWEKQVEVIPPDFLQPEPPEPPEY